jgi:hypothetical protein
LSVKKTSIIFLLIILLAGDIFAQFSTSVWAGLNSTSFGGNPPLNGSYESVYGYSFGGDLNFQITDEVIIAIEPAFDQMGSKIVFGAEESVLDTVITYTIKQNYLGIGALFKINTKRFFVGSGLTFQLLTGANISSDSNENDIKDAFIDYNILVYFTAGYKIPVGTPTLFIELRYLQGLPSIYSDNAEYSSEIYIANFKTTGLKLSFGAMFPL